MDKELTDLYTNLILDLKSQKRGRISLSDNQLAQIHSILLQEEAQKSSLQMALCLLSHCQHAILSLDRPLLKLLENLKNLDLLVMALGTFEHIVLLRKSRNGDRVNTHEINILKKLLLSESLEIVEWTLRLIEGLGAQAVYFKKELLEWKRPNFIQNPFNPRYKAVKALILYINSKMEK